jgi:hypothetical protein
LLPINFHQTFIPERRYVSSLLQYAASGSKGTLDEIAEQTGIPMGKSSGKAHATIDYARGMNLIELASLEEKLVKKPTLTSFGAIVCVASMREIPNFRPSVRSCPIGLSSP